MLPLNQDFTLGLDDIDAEHRRLIDMIRRLDETSGHPNQVEMVQGIMRELAAYVDEHFRNEEHLLAKAGYPGLAAHRELHLAFKRKVDDIRLFAHFDAAELEQILLVWLVEHIMTMDREYVPWVEDWQKGHDDGRR